MRVAAIYDVHGNLPALEAVLQQLRHEDVDQIVVGGDVVPGPTRATDYPDAQEFVAQYVLQQPSAADMLELFTSISLR